MSVDDLISALDYDKSPSFVTPEHFDDDPARAHVLRRARERFGLRGVYALLERGPEAPVQPMTPVVYVCDSEKAGEEEAREPDELHRLVWNQNATPFLLVATKKVVRLYAGFKYDPPKKAPARAAILEDTIDNAVRTLRQWNLDARSVDDGSVWSSMGRHVTPSERVDWRLLRNLRELGEELSKNERLPRKTAHALIGKYVYLRYLRDRDILSDEKLKSWGLKPGPIFGRNATLGALRKVVERLEEWLNGSIFPLPFKGDEAPSQDDIRLVASRFAGDERGGQMHLGFEAYDFSYIPIETLSNVYELFLHAEKEASERPRQRRARQLGAYYTPVHLVDFILDELDTKRPLTKEMTVFDPACGSGAFLVQAYRRIIERERAANQGVKLTPAKLADLLTKSIFGLDIDEDACRVAHLSLSLTLLDYVRPRDLDSRMPDLMRTNIFHCPEGFFDPDSPWRRAVPDAKYDWIVSNPPWRDIKSNAKKPEDRHALVWMKQNKGERPTGGNQIAEAFAWHVTDFLAQGGSVGMLLPAMTLFKAESADFRGRLFGNLEVWCVANFANLREVLFTGLGPSEGRGKGSRKRTKRSRAAAAAFFYASPQSPGEPGTDDILTYAPFVVTQEANRSQEPRERKDIWTVVVDGSEVKRVPVPEASKGDSLVWKAAMWGSPRDTRLIQSLRRRFDTFAKLAEDKGLAVGEGPQIRDPKKRDSESPEEIEPCDELVGKKTLDMKQLRNAGRIYAIPEDALVPIDVEEPHVRKGRKDKPLSVCCPPHVIVDAARRFAVFSDEFIALPARQVGIAGGVSNARLLKAVALFLASRFATYYDFMLSPQWGVGLARADLSTLRSMPTPLAELKQRDLSRWAALHDRLVRAFEAQQDKGLLRRRKKSGSRESVAELEAELNEEVYRALGLDEQERWLVEDLVNQKLKMIESRWDESLVRAATEEEMREYADALRRTLDDFLGEESRQSHGVTVDHDGRSAWVRVSLGQRKRGKTVAVKEASGKTAASFEELRQRLRREHGQWFYFNRSLRVFEGRTTHMLKPRYRLAWLRSQALADADDLIADILTNEGE